MKRSVIVKDANVTIMVGSDYLSLKSLEEDQVIGFRHIKAVYLNKALSLDIGECYKIMQKVPLFLIDEHGYILAQLHEETDHA